MSSSPYGDAPKDTRHEQLLPSTAYSASAPLALDSRFANRRDDVNHDRSGSSAARRRGPDPALPSSREPTTSPSRGNCKACCAPIKGKSISSADGRLTGKYHKACFVCTKCMEPFASAEFYVLDDKPYCEQHYHKLNGSLCGGCGCGIEGQYLEDEARIKYHVGCFRCLDCGRSLSDGYFEVDDNAYCERDAWRRTQQQPPLPGSGYGYDTQRGTSGSRPGFGAGPGSYAGRRPGHSGSGSAGGSRPLPGGSERSRPKMNKRMTRLGRM